MLPSQEQHGATTLLQQATAHLELEESGRFGALARERAAKPHVAGTEPCVTILAQRAGPRMPNMLEPP